MKIRFVAALVFSAVLAFAAEVCVTVLQTTDTHSSLTRLEREFPKPCFLQLASLIKDERSKDPEAILIDCGDCVQGSISASISNGMAGLQPILSLPYDVWVPGNHELDYGVEMFAEYCRVAGDKLLCGNLKVKGGTTPPAWRIFNRKGARIAVIGMSASYYRNWLLASDFAKIECTMAVDALKHILPEVMDAKPDAIVLAIHQAWFEGRDKRGVNEVNEIAEKFPEIDLILGGHSHREIPGQRIGKKAWYVQAGALAKSLGVVKITVDTDRNRVTGISSHLRNVDEKTPEDSELAASLESFVSAAKDLLAADTGIILQQTVSHEGSPGRGCGTSALIAAAIAEATGADAAFHGKLYNISLNKGKINAETFFWLVPYENRIVTFDVTAAQLEQLMTEQWGQRKAYRYNGPWNMKFAIRENKAELLSIDDEVPAPDRKWRVAFNSHAAAGSGAFPVLMSIVENPASNVKVSSITTREAVVRYLKKHQAELDIKADWIEK